ncbi:MAG TPA: glycosyltransferase [Smithella sp.]|nr:glycosyltransferase [Smithella sp.]HOG90817.1 glycosyltransferase [Smithella sp.]
MIKREKSKINTGLKGYYKGCGCPLFPWQCQLQNPNEGDGPDTVEADEEHFKFLKQISYSDFKNYFNENTEHCERTYKISICKGYKKTASCIFMYLLEMHREKKSFHNFMELIKEEVIGSKDIPLNDRVWEEIFSDQSKSRGKPTLLFYTNFWIIGGLERVLSTLFEELSKKYDIIFVSNHHKERQAFEIPSVVKHILIDETLEEKLPFSLLLLNLLFKVNIFIGNSNFVYTFLDTYLLLKDWGVKTVAVNHGYYFLPYWTPYLYPVITKRNQIYGMISAVIWLTKFGGGIYKNSFNNGVVIPNLLSFDTTETVSINKVHNTILCVGRFDDKIKRLDLIFRVFKKVLIKNPNAKLCIVGTYNLDQIFPQYDGKTLRQLLDELQIPPHAIQWKGEQQQVEKYYKNSNLLMMTSDNEGFGMVLLEAGYFKLPCVLFEIKGVEDIIINNENGYIIAKDNLDEMADKILFLLSNEDIAARMGRAAHLLAKRFDKKIISAKWDSLFEILLGSDDQDEINKKLSEEFPLCIENPEEFIKNVINEYERNITKVIDTYSLVKKTELSFYQSAIEEIYNSTSWRITKPFRLLKKILMSIVNGLFKMSQLRS